jgi:hypothetical protein
VIVTTVTATANTTVVTVTCDDHVFILLIQVENVALLLRIQLVFQFFLAILETLPCLLLLAVTPSTIRILAANHASKDVDVFSKQTTLFKKKKFCANP